MLMAQKKATDRNKMLVYDTDPQRSKRIAIILMKRFMIDALPYQEVAQYLDGPSSQTILLIHCDALNGDFFRLARLRLAGNYVFRFYCTEKKDRISQVAYFPDDISSLVALSG